jgi:hypothetical protein
LGSARRCPECGEPARDTLRGTTLYRAGPSTLLKIRNGLMLLLAASVFFAAAAFCSDERILAIFSLGGGSSRSFLLAATITQEHRSAAFVLSAISLALFVMGTFALTASRGLIPIPSYSGDLRLALRLTSIITSALFAICLIRISPLKEIVWVTLAVVEIGQSFCCLFYLQDLSRTAGFSRLAITFRLAMWLAAGRFLAFVPLWSGTLGILSDFACGVLAAILMLILAMRLSAIAHDNRRCGVNDWPPLSSEPSNRIG